MQLSLNGVRVLCVEDDPDTCELLTAIFEQAGASVITVSRAVKAMVLLPQSKPDILIADIALPDIDGYALIRQVRALPKDAGGNVIAIALTGYAYASDRSRALSAGYNEHVSKPSDPDTLVALIAKLLGKP